MWVLSELVPLRMACKGSRADCATSAQPGKLKGWIDSTSPVERKYEPHGLSHKCWAELLGLSGQKCSPTYMTPVSFLKPSRRFNYKFIQALEAVCTFKGKLLLGKFPEWQPLLSCIISFMVNQSVCEGTAQAHLTWPSGEQREGSGTSAVWELPQLSLDPTDASVSTHLIVFYKSTTLNVNGFPK